MKELSSTTATQTFHDKFSAPDREVVTFIHLAGYTGTTRNSWRVQSFVNQGEITLTQSFYPGKYMTMGGAYGQHLHCKIYEFDTQTTFRDLSRLKVVLNVGYRVPGPQGSVITNMGIYYITEWNTYDNYKTVEFDAYDIVGILGFRKFTYTGTLPTTDTALFTKIKDDITALLKSTYDPNNLDTQFTRLSHYNIFSYMSPTDISTDNYNPGIGFQINEIPSNVTYQDILGWLVGLQGYNAFTTGTNTQPSVDADWQYATRVRLKWYEEPTTLFTITREQQCMDGFRLTGAVGDQGAVFTGIICDTGKEILSRYPLIVVTMYNPWMTQTRLNSIVSNSELTGVQYDLVGEIEWFGDPLVDVGDWIQLIDPDGNSKNILISEMKWNFTGGCRCNMKIAPPQDVNLINDREEVSPTVNSAVNKVLNTINKYIKETYNNGSSGYNLYNDNTIEMWGKVDINCTVGVNPDVSPYKNVVYTGSANVSFYKTLADTYATVFLTSAGGDNIKPAEYSNFTVNGMTVTAVKSVDSATVANVFWLVKGRI